MSSHHYDFVHENDTVRQNRRLLPRDVNVENNESYTASNVFLLNQKPMNIESKDPRLRKHLNPVAIEDNVNTTTRIPVTEKITFPPGTSASRLGLSTRLSKFSSTKPSTQHNIGKSTWSSHSDKFANTLNNRMHIITAALEQLNIVIPAAKPASLTHGNSIRDSHTVVKNPASPLNLNSISKGYLSLEEYEAEVKAGHIQPYSGKAYPSAEARYADGWAVGLPSRRWVKVSRQSERTFVSTIAKENEILRKQVKEASKEKEISAAHALEATKLLDQITDMASQLASVKISTEFVHSNAITAPLLLVLDTNCLLGNQDDAWRLINDVLHIRPDSSLLVPREVQRELDRKKGDRCESVRFKARESSRLLQAIYDLKRAGPFPALRGQSDEELYVDNGHHASPAKLHGDDAILNCCLYFIRTIRKRVVLCTQDRCFRQIATANGITSESMHTINPAQLPPV